LVFYSLKKVALPVVRDEENFFEIGCTGYHKKWNFALIQKCAEVSCLAKGKRIFTETEFLGT
jgi:hypothetical protein